MGAFSCFIDDTDVSLLMERLNADSEIAIIVGDGPRTVQEAYHDRVATTINSFREKVPEGSSFTSYGLLDTGNRQRWKVVDKVSELAADGRSTVRRIDAMPM